MIECGPVYRPASSTTTAAVEQASALFGFDMDRLKAVIVKRQGGQSITASEENLIGRMIDELRRIQECSAGRVTEHALSIRRRWLATLQ